MSLRHGSLTLKMRTASFAPCIKLEKSAAGSAFSTVTGFIVNGRSMHYSLCYKRPLTDSLIVGTIVFFFVFFFASYPTLNYDFGCRIQIKKKDKKNLWHSRLFITLQWYYDKNPIFPIYVILKHKRVACIRRKMLFTIFIYLFSFQRYSSF